VAAGFPGAGGGARGTKEVVSTEEKKPQVPPLRCAPVEMTKERAVLPGRVVAEQGAVFHRLGWAAGP
jgi:hypothetical protein